MKKLNTTLNELFLLANGRSPNFQEKSHIEELLLENGFEGDGGSPEWLCNLLNQVASKRPTTGRVPYDFQADKGDITNLLAGLQPIINAQWDDYGEAIEIWFDFGVFVYIGRMGRFWEVKVDR